MCKILLKCNKYKTIPKFSVNTKIMIYTLINIKMKKNKLENNKVIKKKHLNKKNKS